MPLPRLKLNLLAMSKSANKIKGFSLIEAMIAIVILTVAILSLAQVFPRVMKISRSAEMATVAANLSQAKIEEMFYTDYDNITVGIIEAKHRLSADSANPFYQYQRQTVANYVDSSLNNSASDTGMKKITVTTYWYSPMLSLEKSQEMIILISRK